MVWWIMAHSDHKGTDVRLSAGQVMEPSLIPRQGVNSAWWSWRDQFAFSFIDADAHINEKELRAAFMEIRRRARSRRNIRSRYLHLLDSAVSLGVLTKHRSTSHKPLRVLRKVSSVELAASLRPIFSFVRSALNPADSVSRRRLRYKPSRKW